MYVMSYFRTEAEALHLALSEDGFDWRPLNGNRPLLEGSVGTRTLRDPFVMRAQDGRFHLFATNGWKADSIVHASSADLLTWSDQALVHVMAGVPGTRNCWAPECFYDEAAGAYRVIWSSSLTEPSGPADLNHRIWGATTRDFVTYTPAARFFDPGFSVIDATVVRHPNGYLMAFKDERGENRIGTEHKFIHVCVAPNGDGPWTEISEPVTPSLTEGPTLFRRDGRWVMLFDHFLQDFFGAMESPDGVRWENITERVTFPPGPRHASVLEVDEAVGRNLRERAG